MMNGISLVPFLLLLVVLTALVNAGMVAVLVWLASRIVGKEEKKSQEAITPVPKKKRARKPKIDMDDVKI